MLNFSEYYWNRVEKAFIETCESTGIDPKKQLIDLMERMFPNQVPNRPVLPPGYMPDLKPTGSPKTVANRPPITKDMIFSPPKQTPNPARPSDQELKSFNNNAKYARIISKGIQNGIPHLLKRVYTDFLDQFPNQNPNKIKNFLNTVAAQMNKSVQTMMNNSMTNVGGLKVKVNDPYMQGWN